MRNRFRMLKFASVALVALTFAPATPVRAQSCNVSDLWNAAEKGISGGEDLLVNHKDCVTYFDDYVFWILSGLIAHGEAARPEVVDACSLVKQSYADVKGALKWTTQQKTNLDSWLKFANDAVGCLSPEKAESLSGFNDTYGDFSKNFNEATGDVNAILEYLHYAACSCVVAEDSGGVQLSKVAGSCISDVACFLFSLVGDSCSSNPEPLVSVPCTYPDDPPVILQGSAHCSDDVNKNGMCWDSYAANPGVTGNVCMCPAPMHFVQLAGDTAAYTCACPAGTKPQKVGLSTMCLCSDNQPAASNGSCPQKCDCKCPNNQVAQSQGYKISNGPCSCDCGCPADLKQQGDHCDPPACAGGGQVRIGDGSCCVSSQVTSCGVCCKVGQKPNASGSCVSASLSDNPNLLLKFDKSNLLLQKYIPKSPKP